MFRWLSDYSIKYKLSFAYCSVLLTILIGCGIISYNHFHSSIKEGIVDSLEQTTNAVLRSVRLSLNVSVRNYLRATAETQLQAVQHYYAQYQQGVITEAEARQKAREAILIPAIGQSGYTYCLNSKGTVAVHPIPQVEGLHLSHLTFIQNQIARKSGYLEYDWKNPSDPAPRAKALYMEYFEPWDWIISVSGYRNEFPNLIMMDDVREDILSYRLGETGYAFLMDTKGNLLIHPEDGDCGGGSQNCQLLFDEMQTRLQGTITYKWKDKQSGRFRTRMILYRVMPEYDWIVGISVYQDDLYRPLTNFTYLFLMLSGGALLLAIIAGLGLGYSISKPLDQLRVLMSLGAAGDYTVRYHSPSEDEVGTLGSYFNMLMENLNKQRNELEQTVAARTSELSHINDNFQHELAQKTAIENQLRGQLTLLDTLINTIPNPVFYRDTSGSFIGCNKRFAHLILGAEPEDVQGKSLKDFPEAYSNELRQDVMSLDSVLAEKGSNVLVEVRMSCADGTQRHFMVHKAAFYDADGMVGGIIGVMTDISEKDREEQARILLERAVERTSSAIMITDAHGIIQYVNKTFENITGFSRVEIFGQTPAILKSGVHSRKFYENMWNTIRYGDTWSGRMTNRRKNGTKFEAESTISPIPDESGDIRWYVCVQNDITEKIRMETQLLQAQKLESIGQLAAGIAHEINTPIQFIGDNNRFAQDAVADLLSIVDATIKVLPELNKCAPVAKAGKAIETTLQEKDYDFLHTELPTALSQAQDGIERVTTIVKAMKEFSHPGKREMQFADINTCIQNTVTVSRNEWKYVADVELDLDDTLAPIRCMPGDLNQAIMNIVVNAAHAIADVVGDSGDKGRITIGTTVEGENAVIRITDTGGGISQDHIELIFDPFFTTKEVGKGTGQGLAIARNIIVDKHNGQLQVESSTQEGTTFVISLPMNSTG